jgi:hypothetical protein
MYRHVLNRDGLGGRGPVDRMLTGLEEAAGVGDGGNKGGCVGAL